MTRWIIVAIISMSAIACARSEAAPTPDPAALRISLNRSDGSRPLAGMDREYPIRIDPTAVDQVTPISRDGRVHRMYWSTGFEGGTAKDPVVRDPNGEVVARNGDILTYSGDGFPKLHGYAVCFGDGLYVLLQGPT
jgi:hypothetical protein